MSEKKNEVLNEENLEKKKVESPDISEANNVSQNNFEEFYEDAFSYQRERDESGISSVVEGDETVYSVPLLMQRYAGHPAADGKIYYRYGVGFKTKRNGIEIPMKFYVVPPQATTEMYNLAAFVFENSDKKPLEIVRTVRVSVRNGKTTSRVSYGMRVSSKDDYGSVVSCDFKPQSTGDNAMFTNLVNVLRARDIIK